MSSPAAIVTGVSRGLGAALGHELLERGFTVLGIGRRSDSALAGDRYRFVRFDLADSAELDSTLAPAFEELNQLGLESICLVNNAATVEPVGTLGRLESGDIASALAVNLTAAVGLANLFCRVFSDEKMQRRVVNISSGAAEHALPGEPLYCIAKAGIEMLTETLAAEQEVRSFQAVSVRPGVIDTDMQLFARSQTADVFPSVELFRGFHREGRLIPPEVVAPKIVSRLVTGPVESGRTYSYQDL